MRGTGSHIRAPAAAEILRGASGCYIHVCQRYNYFFPAKYNAINTKVLWQAGMRVCVCGCVELVAVALPLPPSQIAPTLRSGFAILCFGWRVFNIVYMAYRHLTLHVSHAQQHKVISYFEIRMNRTFTHYDNGGLIVPRLWYSWGHQQCGIQPIGLVVLVLN